MYPVTIISDRYGGVYSGAAFLAFNEMYYNLPTEIDGNDVECCTFWSNIDENKIGFGSTPMEAYKNLLNKLTHDSRSNSDMGEE